MARFKIQDSARVSSQMVAFETPRHFLLNGLWLGARRLQTVYIYVHGLSSTLFSQKELTTSLVSADTGVLVFDNRGSGIISRVPRLNARLAKGYKTHLVGAVHEIFTDCVDDLDGAVSFVRRQGAKRIFLVGHSTGCQKSIYYLAKRPRSVIKGAVLLAPMSDFADIDTSSASYKKALNLARRLVKAGKKHELLPLSVWPKLVDAQRFLSLHTPDSIEEIFSYATGRRPVLLEQVNKPLLVLLAEQDEFRDRPIKEIAAWFKAALNKKQADIGIIQGVRHNFFPRQAAVKKLITSWAKEIN